MRFNSTVNQYTIDAVQAATYRPDSDGDGLPDAWEITFGLNPLDATGNNGANGNPDNDGLTNAQERAAGTIPLNADTDSDGLPDGWEVSSGLNPLDPNGNNGSSGDPDGDGQSNTQELIAGTNPTVPNAPTAPTNLKISLPINSQSNSGLVR